MRDPTVSDQGGAARGAERPRREAAAWRTQVGLLVIAVPLYAYRGRDQWFFQDEWRFLSERDGGSIDGLFAPHNEHWSTLPVIAYRILWNLFGLHHYAPYQAMTISLHLAVVVLARAVMRRLGIGPWVATAAASVLLFYGSGSENVVWAFQIGFLGSVVFGYGHLLLAVTAHPSRRRLAAGLLCGLAALMCSGIGLVMVGVVLGVAADALIRRWRWSAVPIACVVLAGMPRSIDAITPRSNPEVTPAVVLAIAHSERATGKPPDGSPFPFAGERSLTYGWLVDGARSGRIPHLRPSPDVEAAATAVMDPVEVVGSTGRTDCQPLLGEATIRLGPDGSFDFEGVLQVRVRGPRGGLSPQVEVGSFERRAVRAGDRPLTLVVTPDPGFFPETICR